MSVAIASHIESKEEMKMSALFVPKLALHAEIKLVRVSRRKTSALQNERNDCRYYEAS